MKLTETVLLDGYEYTCKGGGKASRIAGKLIYWDYRTGERGDGYNPVCAREDAGEITLEYDRDGTIGLDDCGAHTAVARIASDEAALWGQEMAHA